MRSFQGIPRFPRITRVSQTGIPFEEKAILIFSFRFSKKLKSSIDIAFGFDVVEIHVPVSVLDRYKPPILKLKRIGFVHHHQVRVYC